MAKKDSTPKPKFKKCKVCKTSFQLFRTTQKVCSPNCAIELARIDVASKEKKAHTKKKKELKDNDRSFQLDKTQVIFNKFIRLRDAGNVCISCQKPPRKKNAGHYLSRGAHPELRFHPLNCHLQCEHCNSFKSGNQVLYRKHLIEKIGASDVEWLEGPHKPAKYTIDDLKEIQETYKLKIKEMDNA